MFLAVPVAVVSTFAKKKLHYNTRNWKCVTVLIVVAMLRFPLISAAKLDFGSGILFAPISLVSLQLCYYRLY